MPAPCREREQEPPVATEPATAQFAGHREPHRGADLPRLERGAPDGSASRVSSTEVFFALAERAPEPAVGAPHGSSPAQLLSRPLTKVGFGTGSLISVVAGSEKAGPEPEP